MLLLSTFPSLIFLLGSPVHLGSLNGKNKKNGMEEERNDKVEIGWEMTTSFCMEWIRKSWGNDPVLSLHSWSWRFCLDDKKNIFNFWIRVIANKPFLMWACIYPWSAFYRNKLQAGLLSWVLNVLSLRIPVLYWFLLPCFLFCCCVTSPYLQLRQAQRVMECWVVRCYHLPLSPLLLVLCVGLDLNVMETVLPLLFLFPSAFTCDFFSLY